MKGKRLLLLSILVGCGEAREVAPSVTAPDAERAYDWLAAADCRPAPDEIGAATTLVGRRARALALARLGDPAAAPWLIAGLRDLDPTVRSASALGIGALEIEAPEAAVHALIAALAAETRLDLRAELLFDLGRTGAEGAWPALTDALAADAPELRRGACRGVGAAGLSAAIAPDATLVRVSARLADDSDASVRVACAHALGRSAAVPDFALSDLTRGASDPNPVVRSLSLRALGRVESAPLAVLARGASDADPFVALAALRGLATRTAGVDAFAARLDGILDAIDGASPDAWTPVLLAALEAPSPAVASLLLPTTVELHGRLGRHDPDSAFETLRPRDRGLLHCAAARLADLGDGALTRTPTCGLGAVSGEDVSVTSAELIGAFAVPAPSDLRALDVLAQHASSRVREAAAAAFATSSDPVAGVALRRLVDDADPGVRIAALDGVGTYLRRARAAHDAAALDALLAGISPPPPEFAIDDDLSASLGAALESLVLDDDLEGILTAVAVIEQARDAALGARLAPLLSHHNVSVRRRTRAALEACDLDPLTLPIAPRSPPPAVVRLGDLALDARRARIVTDRGDLVVELWPEVAPTTVTRFVALADAGTFDGLTFHRVVPGFVAQGGDPRGDGYGGPEWSQRCEDNRVTYERGTVGMALAGRDTGGSQFFVTITPQPHLDGRYTAFGRVVEGMDVVDQLVRGDVIRTVRVERGPLAGDPWLLPASW